MISISKHCNREYEVVESIPYGYVMWNIGKNIEEIIRKAGYNPTDELVANMKNVNIALNKFHTVAELK